MLKVSNKELMRQIAELEIVIERLSSRLDARKKRMALTEEKLKEAKAVLSDELMRNW